MEYRVIFEEFISQPITVYMGDGCDAQDVCTPDCGG